MCFIYDRFSSVLNGVGTLSFLYLYHSVQSRHLSIHATNYVNMMRTHIRQTAVHFESFCRFWSIDTEQAFVGMTWHHDRSSSFVCSLPHCDARRLH